MKTDPIVEEVRRARDEHAKKFKYNLSAIIKDLKAKEKRDKWPKANLSPRRKAFLAVAEDTAKYG